MKKLYPGLFLAVISSTAFAVVPEQPLSATNQSHVSSQKVDIAKVHELKFNQKALMVIHDRGEVKPQLANYSFSASKQADGQWSFTTLRNNKLEFSGTGKGVADSEGILKFKGTGIRHGEKVTYTKLYYPIDGHKYYYVTQICIENKMCMLMSGKATLVETK